MNVGKKVLIGILVLIVAFAVIFGKKYTSPQKDLIPATIANPATPTPENFTKTFTLLIKNKKLASGPEVLTVSQGDNVTINITADTDDEFHLHGYDESVDLEKNKTAEISFTADASGRFIFELEKSKVELGALEVQPK